MTKHEFLLGVKFSTRPDSKNKTFEFVQLGEGNEPGYIKEQGALHHCNVSSVTRTGFKYYTVVLGRVIKGFIKFENLYA